MTTDPERTSIHPNHKHLFACFYYMQVTGSDPKPTLVAPKVIRGADFPGVPPLYPPSHDHRERFHFLSHPVLLELPAKTEPLVEFYKHKILPGNAENS